MKYGKEKNGKNNPDEKPRYEAPVIVPLGEAARGSGICGMGSAPSGGGGNCSAGPIANAHCSDGAVAGNPGCITGFAVG